MDSQSRALVKKLGLREFQPLPFVRTGKLQTIVGTYWPQQGELKDTQFFTLDLGDGDELVLAENTPTGWQTGGRIVCLVHGLTGSHLSNYMIRMTRAFTQIGAKVIRMNLRSCGPGWGKARRPYHCGISPDARRLVEHLAKLHPLSPVTLIGFSLGGNIVLKMAGEDHEHPTGSLDSVVAVSPPVDVKQSSLRLSSKENAFFDQYFTRRVMADVKRLHSLFPELPPAEFPRQLNLAVFDDCYTAPRSGFKNGEDYYRQASSLPHLKSIRVPTLIIGSMDDPVVSGECFEKISRTSWVDKIISRQGGHVGFLGFGGQSGFRWADEIVLRWAREHLKGFKYT